MAHTEIFAELQAIPEGQNGTVHGFTVTRINNDFRAIHDDGHVTSWWTGNTLAYIIDDWVHKPLDRGSK
jgi:hypothetical protein